MGICTCSAFNFGNFVMTTECVCPSLKCYITKRRVAERLKAAVLKTVGPKRSRRFESFPFGQPNEISYLSMSLVQTSLNDDGTAKIQVVK